MSVHYHTSTILILYYYSTILLSSWLGPTRPPTASLQGARVVSLRRLPESEGGGVAIRIEGEKIERVRLVHLVTHRRGGVEHLVTHRAPGGVSESEREVVSNTYSRKVTVNFFWPPILYYVDLSVPQLFGAAVLATHSDISLAILGDGATAAERATLGAIRYGCAYSSHVE